MEDGVLGQAKVYKYSDIFVEEKSYHFGRKEEVMEKANHLFQLRASPPVLQTLYHLEPHRDITCTHNYTMVAYVEHYNYTLAQHLDVHRVKGTKLLLSEVFYILKSLAELGSFLHGKNLHFLSLDPHHIFIDSSYCVRVPMQHVE